jgi:hypothetical protein
MVEKGMSQYLQSHITSITDKKVFMITISDLFKKDCASDLPINLEFIDACTDDYDIIIIDYATNYTRDNNEETVYRQLIQCTVSKPWIIVTSNFNYYNQQHTHIIYYPIYLIDGLDKGGNTEIEIKNQRNHNICFLTYHYYWHRILILLELYRRMDFKHCLITLPKLGTLNDIQMQGLKNSVSYLTATEQQLVNKMFELAPLVADPTDLREEIANLKNKAFYDSYINIFTESDYGSTSPYITEKSVKPFFSGQFFAVFGHPTSYAHLKELGFDLFEDYLPMPQHEEFRQNIKELIDMINDLIPKIGLAWDNTYDRRLCNYTLARSPALREKLCHHLRTHLQAL